MLWILLNGINKVSFILRSCFLLTNSKKISWPRPMHSNIRLLEVDVFDYIVINVFPGHTVITQHGMRDINQPINQTYSCYTSKIFYGSFFMSCSGSCVVDKRQLLLSICFPVFLLQYRNPELSCSFPKAMNTWFYSLSTLEIGWL